MKITVFINPTCNPCKALKQWLWKNNVEFIERDAINDEAAARELRSLNVNFTPYTVIETAEGRHEISGADIKKISEVLSMEKSIKVF
ncbi:MULTISPECIES: glutaredoxin family protein [Bacillus]|uniref:glutaredoxin family protein n=1 Tax=Bacillus TaxID=1386 RepID=UPI0005575953|nr:MULTISPECIES: glutaredoxin family protein [Bacillus]QHZ48337.1 glutaredoxin family protein [Bacillus sp. NSP9.1]WFA06000.1 glutaredoxin family protein [Bacillus sp. HSf4]